MTNREFFLHQYTAEGSAFERVIGAAPGDALSWRPHDRSRSATELIGHLIGHDQDLEELLTTGSINHRMQVGFSSVDEALALVRKARASVIEKVSACSEADWTTPGQFLVNGNTVLEAPRLQLAWMMLLDAIHHRGQLSTYLRPMGGKVPAIYGPSADEQPGAPA
jgi:uncharacterized damage-inducible protein DinB